MERRLGVVMDPISDISIKKDTTLGLLLAASRAGYILSYMEQTDLYIENGTAMARTRPIQVFNDPKHWFELGEPADRPLADMDVVLMRKDPPFDGEYIYSTYILEMAESQGTLIVNNPASLRDCNEKVFATSFPQCCPPLLVSRDMARLRDFHKRHKDAVYKPLDGMGGSLIFRVTENDLNLNVILEALTKHGQRTIMAQKFLPEIRSGDKRILMIDGEAIPYCLARIPSDSDTRGNLAAGGRGIVQPLSDRDRWIAEQVGPSLKEKGLLFVGLDVIGDYLTEINVTSPTCLREIERETDLDIGAQLMHAIEAKLAS
ncbi:MAG: glutathione synthase [bacterium]